jgi:NitT/TauT family transport system permease protein
VTNAAIPAEQTGRTTSGAKLRRRHDALFIATWRILLIGGLLALWEFSAGRLFNEFWSSKPSEIAERIAEMAASGEAWRHCWTTLSEAGTGLFLGAIFGISCGLILARRPRTSKILDPIIMGLYGLPRVALAPLFILWFGIGLVSKVMISFSMVLFIFLLNTLEGIRTIDPDMLDLVRTMRASRAYTLRRVLLPSIVPWIMASFRIAIGLSLIGAVVGELVGANEGLGWYVSKSSGQLDTTGVFAGLTLLLLMAAMANQLVLICERSFVRWRR